MADASGAKARQMVLVLPSVITAVLPDSADVMCIGGAENAKNVNW